jgi:hypothetical protein
MVYGLFKTSRMTVLLRFRIIITALVHTLGK